MEAYFKNESGIYVPGDVLAPIRRVPSQKQMREAQEKLFGVRLPKGLNLVGGFAADAWAFYDSFSEAVGDNTIDMDTDTFKVALFLSTSNCATVTQATFASLTSQHAAANGYTTGGNALTSVTWVQTGGSAKFDAADPVWTAAGGSIICRFAVVYSVTATGNDLVCFSLLDNTPANVTVTDGNTLTLQLNANGILTLA